MMIRDLPIRKVNVELIQINSKIVIFNNYGLIMIIKADSSNSSWKSGRAVGQWIGWMWMFGNRLYNYPIWLKQANVWWHHNPILILSSRSLQNPPSSSRCFLKQCGSFSECFVCCENESEEQKVGTLRVRQGFVGESSWAIESCGKTLSRLNSGGAVWQWIKYMWMFGNIIWSYRLWLAQASVWRHHSFGFRQTDNYTLSTDVVFVKRKRCIFTQASF